MGREIKRVKAGFDWPLEKTWEGFINPHYKKCPDCDGSGSTTAMHRLSDLVSLLMLSGDDSARGKCHPYFIDVPLYRSQGIAPSDDMKQLTEGLAGRPGGSIGHDAIDRWSATTKIIKSAGLSKKWGVCTTCKGDGIAAEARVAYKRWRSKEPPKGIWWQVWETVSEGSPVTPAFATREELVDYLVEGGDAWDRKRGRGGWTRENAMKFVDAGWAASLMQVGGKFYEARDGA